MNRRKFLRTLVAGAAGLVLPSTKKFFFFGSGIHVPKVELQKFTYTAAIEGTKWTFDILYGTKILDNSLGELLDHRSVVHDLAASEGVVGKPALLVPRAEPLDTGALVSGFRPKRKIIRRAGMLHRDLGEV